MPSDYYSDRVRGHTPRINENIPSNVWGGLVGLVNRYLSNGGFGIDFPSDCPDGRGPTGTNERAFKLTLEAEVPGISFPLRSDELPDTLVVLDLLNFVIHTLPFLNRAHTTASLIITTYLSTGLKDVLSSEKM